MTKSTKRLPRSTRARLLAVADLLEAHPSQWDQNEWFDNPTISVGGVTGVAGIGHHCGTTACVAGWAIALTPKSQVKSSDFVEAGAASLGIEGDLADRLFVGTFNSEKAEILCALRVIAEIPEGKRTLAAAKAAGAFERVAS